MELYIDNQRAEIDASSRLVVSLSVATLDDPRVGRAGYVRTMRLPLTPTNDIIFGYAAEILSVGRFNSTAHVGRVEHQGVVLIEGELELGRTERTPQGGFYEVHIIGAAREWVSHALANPLGHTSIEYSGRLTGSDILASWTKTTPVRFLPVAREKYTPDHSSGSVIAAAKILSSDDYHPFIHAATLLRRIFAESGFTLSSDFMDGKLFSSLYISGNYPSRDTSTMKANMDFLARRFEKCTAIADYKGRVYANPLRTTNSVGNIVDCADPKKKINGIARDDIYTNGGCFGVDDRRVVFVPTTSCSVGFQYHLRYTTDFRMASRTRLVGFDTIYLGEEEERSFILPNPYTDRRGSFGSPRSYTLAVFGNQSGREFEFRYQASGNSGITYSSPLVTKPFEKVEVKVSAKNPKLFTRQAGTTTWSEFTGDWALYDGYVGETGTIDVEVTLRSAPEEITPGRPKYFDGIYFGGAESGMRLVMKEGIWVRPIFYGQPTLGSALKFGDVCALEATQMDLVNAFRQMFNLRFHTDPRARVVRVEPADTFYCPTRIVDWTNKIDSSRPITIEEPPAKLARGMEWRYRSGDGAVERENRLNGGSFGSWTGGAPQISGAEKPTVWENALFTPSITTRGNCWGAPSGQVVQAGDPSIECLDRTENLNFAPKIVSYEGMASLPSAEHWGWPAPRNSLYPKVAFDTTGSGHTLCFADRTGYKGLNTYWQNEVRMWLGSRKMTMWLTLGAVDIESLSFPTGRGVDFRCLFRLVIGGEESLWRLEEVCDYSPDAPSTKCVFIKHIP